MRLVVVAVVVVVALALTADVVAGTIGWQALMVTVCRMRVVRRTIERLFTLETNMAGDGLERR